MNDYFATASSAARAELLGDRAASHRTRIALGMDLRARVMRPLIDRADRAYVELAARRDDAAVQVAPPQPVRVRHA